MKKKTAFMKKSIMGLLRIGMAVQIVLGFCFIIANLFSVQQFFETAVYKEISRTFLLDEYIGVLYPVILFLCPAETILYLLQLLAAFLAGCLFVCYSGLGEERLFAGKNLFASLYLLTIPFLLQLHMAVLPRSFVASLFMVQLGISIRFLRKRTDRYGRDFLLSCLCFAGMALLEPDYLFLGIFLPVWMLLCGIRRKQGKKQAVAAVLCLAGSLCLVLSVNALTQTPGSRGNIRKSLGAAMVSRLAWPCFESNYYFWPEEVKEIMSPMQGREISQYAENVKTVMGPLFEGAFGREKANQYYWQMALRCLSDRTKEVLPRIGEDFMAYLFVPFATGIQLSGAGASYAGYNFGRMWEQAKTFTGFYVDYGICSLAVGMVFVLAALLKKLPQRKKKTSAKGIFLLCAGCMLLQTVWYTMSGTYMMDYKNVPVSMILWYSCILWGVKFYDVQAKED